MQSTPSGTSQRRDEIPSPREVSTNVWKFSLPIPFPLRHVNMYALIGQDGWVLIDAGMGTPDARAAFSTCLEQSGLRIADLQAIVLTHHHPDHIGLSGELHEQSGAAVYMHPIDETIMQISWSGNLPTRFNQVSRFFQSHGVPQTQFWYTQEKPETVRSIIHVPPHEAFTLVEDGDMIELAGDHYRVIWVPGHSDGQVCLLRERDGLFLAADHVLPRITPNIGLYSSQHGRQDPLGDYLASLAKIRDLPATLVLPGHGEPFPDLASRVDEIIEHHDDRLQQLLAMIAERPQHAYDMTIQYFGTRLKSDEAKRMAVAEVLSHLEYLRARGRIKQHETPEGLIHYVLV